MDFDNENACQDDGCGRLVEEVDLIRCKGPGCGGVVSYRSKFNCCLLNNPFFSIILLAGGFQRSLLKTGIAIMIVKLMPLVPLLENGVERRIRSIYI
jgi:hypothetical protein